MFRPQQNRDPWHPQAALAVASILLHPPGPTENPIPSASGDAFAMLKISIP